MSGNRAPGSVRLRVTAMATIAVAAVLLVAAVVLVQTQRSALTEDLDDGAGRIAADIAADAADGTVGPTLVVGGDDDTAAAVVDPEGRVIAATRNLGGEPVEPPLTGSSGERLHTVGRLAHSDGPFRVLSRRLEDGTTVQVALSLTDVDESVAALIGSLVVTAPLILIALAGVVWVVVGRTLRPVEEANRRQARFVADASHELRSPLTRIRSELEVDLAHPSSADPLATHRSVLEETERLQRLVEDLLHTARSDAGVGTPRRVAVDLDDLVQHEGERLRADGRVTVDLSGVSAAQVTGDPDDLARVVRNLADNAAHHARAVVAFTVAETDGSAVLAVADDGPGIPAADRERIFERFARLDEARSAATGGTGLGLAIAREIVERHGGSIAVDPGHGQGARFEVRLPLVR